MCGPYHNTISPRPLSQPCAEQSSPRFQCGVRDGAPLLGKQRAFRRADVLGTQQRKRASLPTGGSGRRRAPGGYATATWSAALPPGWCPPRPQYLFRAAARARVSNPPTFSSRPGGSRGRLLRLARIWALRHRAVRGVFATIWHVHGLRPGVSRPSATTHRLSASKNRWPKKPVVCSDYGGADGDPRRRRSSTYRHREPLADMKNSEARPCAVQWGRRDAGGCFAILPCRYLRGALSTPTTALWRFTVRILHLDEQHGWRGGEQQASYLIRGLALRGHFVAVAGRADSEFLRRDHGLQNLTRVACPFRGERRSRSGVSRKRSSASASVSCATRAIPLPSHASRGGRTRRGRRTLARGFRAQAGQFQQPEKIRVARSSPACRTALPKFCEFGVSKQKLSVINSAQDPPGSMSRLQPRQTESAEDAPSSAMSAPLSPTDHATLIRAFSKVRRVCRPHLVLVGDGELGTLNQRLGGNRAMA